VGMDLGGVGMGGWVGWVGGGRDGWVGMRSVVEHMSRKGSTSDFGWDGVGWGWVGVGGMGGWW
jgi:hypothetical protein